MAAMSLASPLGKNTPADLPAGHDPFSQTITPIQIVQPRATAPVVSLPRPVTPMSDRNTVAGPAETGHGAADNSHKATHTDQDKKRKISYKIPRYNRRNQSRSEPSRKA